MVIALGSRCSHMIKTVEFGPGAVPGFIRDDLESKRDDLESKRPKFRRERKSDSFSMKIRFVFYNHVSGGVRSGVRFLEIFSMMKSSSDIQTGA